MKKLSNVARKEIIKVLLDVAGELASQIEDDEKQTKIKRFLRKKEILSRFRSSM